MARLKDLRDGMLIGSLFGVFASATYMVLWWAMDVLMDHVSPGMVVGWSGIVSGVVAGVFALLGGDER